MMGEDGWIVEICDSELRFFLLLSWLLICCNVGNVGYFCGSEWVMTDGL